MTIPEMIEQAKEKGYSYEWISERADIPLEEVEMIFDGKVESLDYITMSRLRTMFSEYQSYIRESLTAYMPQKQQGEYTIEDYNAIPEERRVELIDGVIYDMAPPTTVHQMICSELGYLLKDYIKNNKGKCLVFTTACGVQLDCDERTVVLPDLFILCDRDKLNPERLYGAPDFVVEVLSPSTRKKDITLKLKKYTVAGVREYWIIDPKKKRVLVYDLVNDSLPAIYTFDDEIPVLIFDGKCKVNFAEIYNDIQFILKKE